jgi:hypothetical protein
MIEVFVVFLLVNLYMHNIKFNYTIKTIIIMTNYEDVLDTKDDYLKYNLGILKLSIHKLYFH